MTKDYIKELRQKVGHDPVILAFAGGVLVNSNNEILLQNVVILIAGVYQVEL